MRLHALMLALTCLAAPVGAQQVSRDIASAPSATSPAALASAHKLIDLMQGDRTLALMFSRLVPLMVNATVTALEANEATSATMRAMEASDPAARKRLLTIFQEEFDVAMKEASARLLDRTAQEYAAAFTEAELNEIIAFYSSGTGKKALTLMPELQQKMALYGQQAGRSVGEIAGKKAMERAMNELLPKQKEHGA